MICGGCIWDWYKTLVWRDKIVGGKIKEKRGKRIKEKVELERYQGL